MASGAHVRTKLSGACSGCVAIPWEARRKVHEAEILVVSKNFLVFSLHTTETRRDGRNRLPTGTAVSYIQWGAAVQNYDEVCLVSLCLRKSLRAKPL